MENEKTLDTLATHLEQNATVKNVFGQPILADGKTIIPVAKVAFGLGGGYGEKHPKNNSQANPDTAAEPEGNGAGAGGGMYAMPKGVYEISSAGTRFIPASNTKPLLIGIAIGIFLRGLLGRKR